MTLAIGFSATAVVLYLAMMAIVIVYRGRSRINRAFLLYLAVMALWQFTALMVSLSREADAALLWYREMTAGMAGQFVFLFSFIIVFLGQSRQRPWLYVGWLIFIGLLATARTGLVIESVSASDAAELHFVPSFGPLVPLVGFAAMFYFGYGTLLLIKSYRRSDSELQRNRIKYLLLAALIISIGAFSNVSGGLQDYPVDVAANVLGALIIAYAVLRHQLLDLTEVVRKGLLYSIPTMLIGILYFLVLSLATRLSSASGGMEVFAVSLLVAVVAAVGAQPLRDRAQLWVDRLFFREKYDSALMLQRLSQTTAALLDIDRLIDMILNEISFTVHMERVLFFLKEERSGVFRLLGHRGLDDNTSFALRPDHPIVEWFAQHTQVLTRNDLELQPQFKALWVQERAELREIAAALFAPVKAKGELVGIFAFGDKRSGEGYAQDERLTLLTLANQTAVAIQNARLYRETQQELAERRKAEQRVRESEARYRLLVENAPVGILLMNREGHITDANPTCVSLLRLSSLEEARSLNILTFAPLVAASIADDFRDCLLTGEPRVAQRPYYPESGEEVYLRYYLTTIRDAAGRTHGVQGIIEDMTEYIRLDYKHHPG